jgi:hypothetical protein
MSTASEILAEELIRRRSRRREIDEEITALRAEADALDLALQSLDAVQARLVDATPHEGNGLAINPPRLPPASSNKLTHVVLRFIADHPNGMRSKDVAEALADKIISKSKDPRRVIVNTLINLAEQGLIERVHDGKYRPIGEVADDL